MNFVKLSRKSKIYVRTLVLLGVFLILAFSVYRLAVTQIPAQKNKLASQLAKEQALRQKSELLRSIEADAASQADIIASALPAQNSSFVAVSQIRVLASQNLIIISNLRIGAESKDGAVASTDIGFDAEGDISSLLTLLESLGGVSPIMVIDKVQINQAGGTARATARVKVFWAELPKVLPAITEPVSDLTPEEEKTLIKVLGLTPPDFVFLEPQTPRENLNPF